MSPHHIAQINIARMLAPVDDPIMAEFVAQLPAINALADGSPGLVWRLQSESGDATSIRVYADEFIFEKFDGSYSALWWVPAGHLPRPQEGKERLDYLREHRDTAHAFSFKRVFPEPVDG